MGQNSQKTDDIFYERPLTVIVKSMSHDLKCNPSVLGNIPKIQKYNIWSHKNICKQHKRKFRNHNTRKG